VRLIEADSADALPRLAQEGERVRLAFVDGLHLFDAALVDFFYVDRLLEPGGAVVLDDLWMPSVRRLVAFVRRNRDYTLERRPPGPAPPPGRALRRVARRYARDPLPLDRSGVKRSGRNACVLRKRADDARDWDFHRAF
jgi:methyltransferase family protein